MLRQLARLTQPVPAAGPRALALAIYSDPSGDPATAEGEGVACVDDAARALDLLALVWQATGDQRIREWADGLLDFVLWMHRGGGLWFNFISGWSGELNQTGITSRPGINFWQARGLNAMVSAATILGDVRAARIVEVGLAAAAESEAPADVRALHLIAQAQWLAAGRDGGAGRSRLDDWAGEILRQRTGDLLINSAGERGIPHLWGHVQEAALVMAGTELERPDLVEAAEASALALFRPVIETGFDLPRVQPYDVQSAIQVMDALAGATGRAVYADLAGLGRAWFDGRNPAGRVVYDRESGAVADGIDNGVVSSNRGAESSIVGGLALLEAAVAATGSLAVTAGPLTGPPFHPSHRGSR